MRLAPSFASVVASAVASAVAPVVVAAVVGVGALAGCVEDTPDGTTGTKGQVVFQAATELVFTSPVSVGSSFDVTFVEKNDDVGLSKEAKLVVKEGDATVTAVEGEDATYTVALSGAGSVVLAVNDDGEEIDTITVTAATITTSALIDDVILGSSDVVDARLPERFAILADQSTRVLITAVDACNDGVLDLGTSDVVVVADEGVDPATIATVTADGEAGFVIEPVAATGSFTLELRTADLDVLAYSVDIVTRDDVDEVHAEVASVDSQSNTARLWGRAFVNDVDVIGMDFDWSSDARVALSDVEGAAVTASISFPTDGTTDDRPGTVTAEAFGTSGTVDLLSLTSEELVVSRGDAPERASDSDDEEEDEDTSYSCAGGDSSGTCAGLIVGVVLLRKRRWVRDNRAR